MSTFRVLFGDRKVLIGMVHLGALPGSPRDSGDLDAVIRRAVEDAKALEGGGADGLMIENFFDAPFCKANVHPVTVSAMTAAALAVRETVSIPIGINVLRNDVVSALSIARVCGADYVRCNIFVGALVTDQGLIEGAAREALQTRKALGSSAQIWADIQVKHAAPIAETPLELEARDAVERGLADALIVSGPATGSPTEVSAVRRAREALPNTPVLVGSGFTAERAAELLAHADGAIVGTAVKIGGKIEGPVDRERVSVLVKAISR